jgi:hypothetical protein
LKLSPTGALISKKALGSAADESAPFCVPLADGSFILAGSSDSVIGADKSENTRGSEDYWILKVDASVLSS